MVDGSASGWSDRFPRQTLGIENCASEGERGGERVDGRETKRGRVGDEEGRK